jgi:integrase
MPTINLTARFVETAKPNGRRTDYFDDSLPGFSLRVSENGVKSWCVSYRFAGKWTRHTFGTFPVLKLADARQRAKDALHDVADGINPATRKRAERDAETFEYLAQQYMERHAKAQKRSWPEDQRIIDHDLLPHFGTMHASKITRQDVNALLERKAGTAPVQANRVRALLNKIWNWGIKKGEFGLEYNPVHLTDRPGGKDPERDRVLSENEIRAVWQATDALRLAPKSVFRLLLLTAQRSGEVRGMQWDELDLELGWWTLPGARTKNKLLHRVPLSPRAVKILEEMKADAEKRLSKKRRGTQPEPSRFVFFGRRPDTCIRWIKKTADQIGAIAEVQFRPHDLRRTAASMMTGMGIPRLIVSKILNHAEGGVTKVYDRYSYDAEKREALEAWARRLQIMVSDLREVKTEA